MAETNPVQIVIELIDSVSDDLAQIQGQLNAIDAESLDIDVDIRAEGEIASTEAQLDAMARDRTVDIESSFVGAMSEGFNMSFDELADIRAVPMDEDPDRARMSWSELADIPNIPNAANPRTPAIDGGRTAGTRSNVDRALSNPTRMLPGVGDDGDGNVFSRLADSIGDTREESSGLGRVVNRLRPRMSHLWNIAAALVPVWISLGSAAIGLGAALGTVAAAGAGVIGLGLIGWGNDAGQSLQIAAEKAQALGQRLGDVLRPAGMTFAPILEDWLEGAPAQAQQLVDPLQQLVAFRGTLEAIGGGFVNWLINVINAGVALEDTISNLVLRFGRLAGGAIIEFLQRMVMVTARNQNTFVQLTSAVGDLLSAALNLSLALTSVLSTLSPLTELIRIAATALNSTLGRTLLGAITLLFALETALGAVITMINVGLVNAIRAAAASFATAYLPWIEAITIATYEAIAAMSTLRAVMATTGIGLALIGGGMLLSEMINGGRTAPRSTSSSSGGSGGGTYINIQGDVGRREMDRLQDEMAGTAQSEISTNQEMTPNGR